jgi:trigger factor
VQWDYGKLITEMRPAAEQAVRRSLLLEAIAEKEAIVVPDDEVEAEVEKIAAAGERPALAVRRMMEKSGDLEALRLGLRERKTLEFLIQHAQPHA